MALVQGWGLAEDDRLLEMVTPFGGGCGGTHRLTCGALSGGLLAMGAAHAAGQLSREATYGLAAALVRDFEHAFGSALCCELAGLDSEDPHWREGYQTSDAYTAICQPCAEFAVRRTWLLVEDRRGHG